MALGRAWRYRRDMAALLTVIDHLVVATPNLQHAVDDVASLLGVRPILGGQHPQWGTQNALLSLGARVYLEIMGPDGTGDRSLLSRPFGIDQLQSWKLVTWVVRSADLRMIVSAAQSEGIELGRIQQGSRKRPDGTLLEWEMTDLLMDREGGAFPYFIDWGRSVHPATSAPAGCLLERLTVSHPKGAWLSGVLARIGIDLVVEEGPVRLEAVVAGPKGRVVLR